MVSCQEEGNPQDVGGDQSSLLQEIVPMLPLETRWSPYPLRQYGGFWISEATLQVGIPTLSTFFKLRSSDVFLASAPKSGTTWLKALAFTTLNRAIHSSFDADGANHPLHHSNPHDCIPFFESVGRDKPRLLDELEALPSPRVLATHLSYSLLPDNIKDESSGCRIVYIARDPKDVLVSAWIFFRKVAMSMGVIVDDESFSFQEAFELFCEGHFRNGPQWHHVLEYWNKSMRRPNKVLFLRYEDMLLDPKNNLKKLAKFMGCEFSQQEDDRGVVDAIIELCSLEKLKNIEANKDRSNRINIMNDIYFRKGVVGDWRNYMTSEMAQRLDNIIGDALQGSGFTFSSLI